MFTTQLLKPCGLLHTQNKSYYLMHPNPLPTIGKWQSITQMCWSVIPLGVTHADLEKINGKSEFVYPAIRSAVCPIASTVIEIIPNIEPIWVRDVPEENTRPEEKETK